MTLRRTTKLIKLLEIHQTRALNQMTKPWALNQMTKPRVIRQNRQNRIHQHNLLKMHVSYNKLGYTVRIKTETEDA